MGQNLCVIRFNKHSSAGGISSSLSIKLKANRISSTAVQRRLRYEEDSTGSKLLSCAPYTLVPETLDRVAKTIPSTSAGAFCFIRPFRNRNVSIFLSSSSCPAPPRAAIGTSVRAGCSVTVAVLLAMVPPDLRMDSSISVRGALPVADEAVAVSEEAMEESSGVGILSICRE